MNLWEPKSMCFEMLRIWMSDSMMINHQTAWLALRVKDGDVNFSDLTQEQQVGINAVFNFFRKLNVLVSKGLLEKDLARELYLEDAMFWQKQRRKLKANIESDENFLAWVDNYVFPAVIQNLEL
jgi:hypothetical protein